MVSPSLIVGVAFLFGFITMGILFIIPNQVKKRIPFCVDCKRGKFWFKREEEVEDKKFNCKKCGIPMQWEEIPIDLFKIRVNYFRLVMALLYPHAFLLLLLILDVFYYTSVNLILPLVLAFIAFPIVTGIFLDIKSRREIEQKLAKLSPL